MRGDGTWAVPTNTTYSAGRGLSLSGTQIGHSNAAITGASRGPTANATLSMGGSTTVPYVTFDGYGHITASANRTIKLPTPLTSLSGVSSNTAVLGAKVVADAINNLKSQVSTLNTNIKSCNDRIDGLNETTSRIINEDLANIGSGATVVGKANIAANAPTPYKGGNGPICTSLTGNVFQFRWTNNQIEVYIDKTRIGYMTTH